MEYPKKVMRMTELAELGFPKEFLMRAYRVRGQTFAQKINPTKSNSAIMFDTENFEKWRMNQLAAENMAIPRGRGTPRPLILSQRG